VLLDKPAATGGRGAKPAAPATKGT